MSANAGESCSSPEPLQSPEKRLSTAEYSHRGKRTQNPTKIVVLTGQIQPGYRKVSSIGATIFAKPREPGRSQWGLRLAWFSLFSGGSLIKGCVSRWEQPMYVLRVFPQQQSQEQSSSFQSITRRKCLDRSDETL